MKTLFLSLTCSIVVSLCPSSIYAAERITAAYTSIAAAYAPFWVAKDKGIFDKYNFDARLIYMRGTVPTLAALANGELDFVQSGASPFIPYAAKGGDVVLLGCRANKVIDYVLIAHPSITTIEQLRGKPIGISRVGSASDVAAQVFLRALGLEPNKDVAILQVGGATERAAAFNSGRISGFPSSPGAAYLAKGVRHKVMMTMNDLPSRYEFPNLCVTVTQSYLQTNRDAVRRAIMAIVEGVHYFKNNKADSKKLMTKYSRQTHDDYLESYDLLS